MKRPTLSAEGFTVVEILAIVALLFVLAAFFLPTLTDRGSRKNYGVQCINNQKQIGIGFLIFATDHEQEFPWHRSTTNGGTLELLSTGQVAPHFQTLSNYLQKATFFVCPTDKSRSASSNYAGLTRRTISYFINADATITNSQVTTVLTGDRNLQANGLPVPPGLFTFQPGLEMSWTRELHSNPQVIWGNVGFADGHVEDIRNNKLTPVLAGSAPGSSRLVVP